MSNDINVKRVLSAFVSLSGPEKAKLIELINEHQRGTGLGIEALNEALGSTITKMHTGPHKEPCAYCGRG